jgi:hypothetical protein
MRVLVFTFPAKSLAVQFCHSVRELKQEECTDPTEKDGVFLVTVVTYIDPTDDEMSAAGVQWAPAEPQPSGPIPW